MLKLNLRGEIFTLGDDFFIRYPCSMLAVAFSSEMQPATKVDDAYYFDRDPILFRRVVLPLYDYGHWSWDEKDDPSIVFAELCYWGLAPLCLPEPDDEFDSDIEVFHLMVISHFLRSGSCYEDLFVVDDVRETVHGRELPLKSMLGNPSRFKCLALRCGVFVDWKILTDMVLYNYISESYKTKKDEHQVKFLRRQETTEDDVICDTVVVDQWQMKDATNWRFMDSPRTRIKELVFGELKLLNGCVKVNCLGITTITKKVKYIDVSFVQQVCMTTRYPQSYRLGVFQKVEDTLVSKGVVYPLCDMNSSPIRIYNGESIDLTRDLHFVLYKEGSPRWGAWDKEDERVYGKEVRQCKLLRMSWHKLTIF